MEVDNCLGNQLHLCPKDFVTPMSLVMDDHGSQPHPGSSGMRVSTKSKAPSPPGLKRLDSAGFSQWYPGNPHLTMDQKENLIDKDLSLVVVLPDGVEKMTTVHGSKPLMDLLVMLCAKYHLNPSSYTLELVTANRNNIKLKPNALIGTLDAEKIILKPKAEDKSKKTGPQMPEATVRMVINYKKTQKTILRVNPRVPLAEILPAICDKCEFNTESTILLKDGQSLAPLDLSSSLNDYAIREVYARDTKGQSASPVCPASPSHSGAVTPGKDKDQKEKENKGLFSMFRKSKKKSDQATTASAPASPVLVSKPRPLSMALPSSNSSPLKSPTSSMDGSKKRRAPQPPILVSQSCTSDINTRQRLNSEPSAQVDSDQMAGLSRGSSAESSLKRTKRKAPPPPTSPSVVVQETDPVDENLQGGAAANTLEEIMEQEETTASVMSATASDAQGEDSSLSLSADVSLHSPSPDTEILSTMSMEDVGEDQSCDLSSDGNQLQSTVNDPAALSDMTTTAGMDSSELADTNTDSCQVENVSQQSICEESTTESVKSDCTTVPSGLPPSLPQPVMQDAEAQASAQANTETLGDQTGRLESPVATSTSCPTGEDAQVQTDFTPLSVPPQQQMDQVPSSDNAPAFESAGKRDMATLTEELDPNDLKHALSHTSETSSCQDSAPCSPAATKALSMYATDSEPKPKPSNELTRDYIPKVGMTTYTIVPQKTLEKLRYFEVALTLEAPSEAQKEGLNIDSLQLEECTASREQTEVSKEKSNLHSKIPREELLTSTTTTQGTANGSLPESMNSSSPASLLRADDKISSTSNGASKAVSPAEVKEMKIPPATKPKPGSFRLAKHKKTPGHYVTSAAEKSLSASPGCGQMEAQESAERAKLPPPPLPPPLQCQDQTTETTNVELSHKEDDKNVPVMRVTRQSSLPSKEPSLGLSLEKLRSFAAPRPYSPTTPSRFAQAVSSAVKRSQSLSHGPKLPQSPVSPTSPISRSPGLFKFKEGENREADSDKGSTLQGGESEPPVFSEVAEMEGESNP
ncbi:cordon-bleu protein-like 1b isoform X1 [Scomber japonicus]|uniref:cordon-bleu protein-like 1b isoform X1 n=2 Tax=Scomber japonicus TaxID=13676 RepID=UPI0023050558|nr:cordon-bleu protein-like 1b isoform X1 [Scomber japonicus]XP_053184951.1 cordon-bleu protein-like 1b isoform X1 [Scomber japonicus]